MSDHFEFDRRSVLARIGFLLGTAAASTISLPALAKDALKPKAYLAPATFDLLTAVADTIVPRTDTAGAVDAGVPTSFDALLVNWAAPNRRYELTQALARIDFQAKAQHGKGFTELDPQTRHAFLTAYDAAALKVLPGKPPSGFAALLAGPRYTDAGYGKVKELIVLLYYLSEPALTQELTYVHAPGEWKPSIPVTPETRPAGGSLI